MQLCQFLSCFSLGRHKVFTLVFELAVFLSFPLPINIDYFRNSKDRCSQGKTSRLLLIYFYSQICCSHRNYGFVGNADSALIESQQSGSLTVDVANFLCFLLCRTANGVKEVHSLVRTSLLLRLFLSKWHHKGAMFLLK